MIILALIGTPIYLWHFGYWSARETTFNQLFIQNKLPSFGAIFGIILFYATPILFCFSIVIYAIAQINKNLKQIYILEQQRRNIETFHSTLKAQTIVGLTDEAVKGLITKIANQIQEATLLNISKQADEDNKPEQKEDSPFIHSKSN